MPTPPKIAVAILVVMIALFGITFLAGDKGIDLGFTSLKYPSTAKFLAFEQPVTADKEVDDIIGNIELMDENDTSLYSGPDVIRRDSAAGGNLVGVGAKERLDGKAGILKLELPEGKSDLLHPFFAELDQIQGKRHRMRILHYGDSQIEGDRITGYLRQRLQNMFGGTGPGFLPIKPVYHQNQAQIAHSDNWIRYAIFDPTQGTKIPQNAYGAYMSLTRFTAERADSLVDTLQTHTAWMEIGGSSVTYTNARVFTHIDLHYGRCKFPVLVKVFNGGELIVQEQLKTDGNYHVFPIRLASTPSKLRIEFEGCHSPDFYGVTLDGAFGLGVDNIAMRGSSGTVFTAIPYGLFNQMIDYLQTELVIMQFGGNSAYATTTEGSAVGYANWFKSQINTVKSLRPEAQIIVIGPSDMSIKEGDAWITHPYLEAVIREMKRVTKEAGAAYWDTYSAMGGKNSMPVWVERGLAGEDYIHFSPAGAKYAAEMFVQALLLEYQHYADKNGGGGAE